MVCDEIARRLPSKAAQSVEEPGRRFEGHICSRQSGVKILTFGPFSFSGRIYIQQQTRSMRCTRSGLNYVKNYSSSAGEWRTCLRTSGQNSTKVLPAIRPKSPETILHRVSAGLVSLLGRHISESTLLPASATKRASIGVFCHRANNSSDSTDSCRFGGRPVSLLCAAC